MKLTPIVNSAWENYDLYHLVLSQPNVQNFDLKNNINKMIKSFATLIRYLKGNAKIKGISFEQYEYAGALRNLEVTFSEDINDYHPHIHCLIAFRKDLNLFKTHINKHSYKKDAYGKYTILYQKFSDFEILIQKIWYLLMNNKEVNKENIEANKNKIKGKKKNTNINKKNIDGLNVGYNCILDLIDEENYHEIFKYSLKIGFDSLSYENFKTLYESLFKCRTLQGYGIFYNLHIDDTLTDVEVSNYYDIIAKLIAIENPVQQAMQFDILLEQVLKANIRLITRKKILLESKKQEETEPLTAQEQIIKNRLLKQYYDRRNVKQLYKEHKEKLIIKGNESVRNAIENALKGKLRVGITPTIADYKEILNAGFDITYDEFIKSRDLINYEKEIEVNTTLRKTQVLRRDIAILKCCAGYSFVNPSFMKH